MPHTKLVLVILDQNKIEVYNEWKKLVRSNGQTIKGVIQQFISDDYQNRKINKTDKLIKEGHLGDIES